MKSYRKNVGIVVFNDRGETLVGERSNKPGAFQYPQGGLKKEESPLKGARRELLEETGIVMEGPPVARLDEWLYYDFPREVSKKLKKYRGQRQKWFFFYWNGNPDDLSEDARNHEFSRLKWSDLDTVVNEIAPFKRSVYERVRDEGRRIIQEFLSAKENSEMKARL